MNYDRYIAPGGGLGIAYGLSTWNPRVIRPSGYQVNAICAFGSGCSGVLVSERCVLTASHCRTGRGDYCVSGANPWDNPRTVVWDGLETDELNLDWPASDLCLVRLNKPAYNAMPIPVASAEGVTMVQAVGHGKKGPGEPRSPGARTWATGIIDWAHSDERKIKVIFDDERNVCFGDSGSPLLTTIGGQLCTIATLSTLGGSPHEGASECTGTDAFYSRLDQPGAMDFIRRYCEYFDGSHDCSMDLPIPEECMPGPDEEEPEERELPPGPTPIPSRRRRPRDVTEVVRPVASRPKPRSHAGELLFAGGVVAAGVLAAVFGGR